MPMALFLVVTVLMISISVVTVIAFQVAQNRNETAVRHANWALDSTLNTAAESIGTSGLNLTDIPLSAPTTWTESADKLTASRWWAVPLDAADTVPAAAPDPFVLTASNGSSVLGITSTNLVYTSPDGRSWTRLGDSPVPATSITQLLVGLGSYIIVTAPNTDAGSSVVYTSRDGGTWTGASGAPTPSATSTETIARMACSSTDCILITTAGTTATRYWTSANAKSWTLATSTTAGNGPAIAHDVTYAAQRFVTVGYSTRNETSFSTDATTWSTATAIPVSDPLNRVTSVNSTFVAASVGTNNPTYPNITAGAGPTEANKTIVTSPDGITWTARSLPVAAHWTDLTSNGTTLTAVAEDSAATGTTLSTGTPIFATTKNGTAWSTRSLPAAGNWTSATPLGSAWLFTAPSSTSMYLVSSTPGQPARADKLLVVAEVKTSNMSAASAYQSVLAFDWNPTAHRWGVSGAYASLDFSLNASFTTNPGSGQQVLTGGGATFTFADTSAGSPTKWAWDFGDGTTSTTQNPTKTYTTSGQYTVTLVVTEPGGVTSTVSHAIAVQAAPTAPRRTVATPAVTSVALAWAAPTDDGDADITDYTVEYRTHGTSAWTAVTHAPTADRARTVTGLDPDGSYDFRVAAVNAVDQGPWSAIITASPLSAPSAPQSLAVTGQLDLDVTWAAPARNGGSPVTVYHVDYATTATFADAMTIDTTNTFQPLTGLTENTRYYIRVRALNIVGASPASTVIDVTTKARPGAPTALSATPTGKDVTVTWTAPASDGGVAIDHYTLEYATYADFTSSSAVQSTGASGPITFTGAPDTTYYLRLTATNAVGTSAPSAAETVLTDGLVSTLPDLATTPGVRSALITWTAPTLAQAGRTPITGYTVTWTAPNGTQNTANLPANATSVLIDAEDTTGDGVSDSPLASGRAYPFTVTAVNAAGEATFTTTATTFAAPSAPGAPTLAVASTTSLTATWTAPASNGGSAVTDYRIQTSTDGTTWTTFTDGTSTATTATITGLTTGVTYYVRIAATSIAGTGTNSDSAFTLLATAPNTPNAPVAALTSSTTATLTWTAPAANGSPITGYTVTSTPTGATTVVTGTSATISGLTLGADYTFTVTAVNALGAGTSSSVSNQIRAAGAPAGPTALTVTVASATSLTATWAAPTVTNGAPITGYRIMMATDAAFTANVQAIDTGTTATTRTLTGLSVGTTYYVTVAAINSAGTGPFAPPASATPDAVPNAPASVSINGYLDAAQLDINYSAPAANGGSPLTGYRVQWTTDSAWANYTTYDLAANTSGKQIQTSTNGTIYTRVAAINVAGVGPWTYRTAYWSYQYQDSYQQQTGTTEVQTSPGGTYYYCNGYSIYRAKNQTYYGSCSGGGLNSVPSVSLRTATSAGTYTAYSIASYPVAATYRTDPVYTTYYTNHYKYTN